MPIPLVPVAVAGAAAWLTFEPGQASAAGAAPAPEEQKPFVEPRRPRPEPFSPTANPTPRAGGDPPPADPVVTLVDGTVAVVGAQAVDVGKAAAEAGGAVLLGGGSIAEAGAAGVESIGSAASSIGSSVSSAAEGAAGVVGPALVIGADVLMVAGAFYDMFGGDLSSLIPGNAAGLTDPQMAQFNAIQATDPNGAVEYLMKVENRTGAKNIFVGDEDVVVGRNAGVTRKDPPLRSSLLG